MTTAAHRRAVFRVAMVAGSLLLLAGCPTRRNPDLPVGVDCDHVSHVCVGTIAITTPASGARTSGKITIQVRVLPADNPPGQVRILKEGVTLLPVPYPFTYSWDTTSEPEGAHEIGAEADIGDRTITATPITVWVDRRPPSIDGRTPAPNATNVSLSDPMTVVFSEALDPSSVSNAAISLSSGGRTLDTVSTLEPDGKTVSVRFVDRTPLSYPATITATVNASVKDLAGNAVGTLPSWSWVAPLWVKLPTTTGSAPALALDATGEALVASLTDAGKLVVSRSAAGATWDPGLGSPTDASVSVASIATDAAGSPVVAWSDTSIRAARWTGSAWTAAGDLSPLVPTADSVILSSVAVGGSGEIFVGWTGNVGISNPGYVASWSGSAWRLLPGGAAAGPGGPYLRVETTGSPVGVFTGSFGAPQRVIARYTDPGGWTTIDSSAEPGVLFALALDAQDRPVILTHATEANVEAIHVRVRVSGGWTDLAPAFPTGSAAAVSAASLQLDAGGRPLVLWTQQDGSGSQSLRLARFNGTAWDTTYGVLNGVAGAGSDPQYFGFAADGAGRPTVAWSERDPASTSSVFVWRSNY